MLWFVTFFIKNFVSGISNHSDCHYALSFLTMDQETRFFSKGNLTVSVSTTFY